jgi:hypothetical protein
MILGFVGLHLVAVVIGMALVLINQIEAAPQWLKTAGLLSGAGTMLIGGLIATTVGSLLGIIVGFLFVQRRRKAKSVA